MPLIIRGSLWILGLIASLFTVSKLIPWDNLNSYLTEISPFNYDPLHKHWNNYPQQYPDYKIAEKIEWNIKQLTPYTLLGISAILTGGLYFGRYYLNKKMKFKFYKNLRKGKIQQHFDWNKNIPYA